MSRHVLPFLYGILFGTRRVSANNATSWTTPFSALGCPKVRATDANWVWGSGNGQWPSCNLNVRGDISTMCVDANGQVDYSSIYVDMKNAQDKTGCFAWTTEACMMRLRQVARIEFDLDMSACGDVWAAPFWLSPRPWIAPGGMSGEIDLVEGCPVGNIATNFDACTGAPEGFCNQKVWGTSWGLGGPKHFIMTLDDNSVGGTLRTQICELDGTNCQPGGTYTNFLQTATPFLGKEVGEGFPYAINSDIWNGYSGDGGWYGCNARNNPSSNCQYAIKNIRVQSTTGQPAFTGKCAVMNGNSPVPPPPGTLSNCADKPTYQKQKWCPSTSTGACWSSDPAEPWACWDDVSELSDTRCQRTPMPNSGANYNGACQFPDSKHSVLV